MSTNPDRVEREVQAAVAGGESDVREDVRRITLEALSDGRLDADAIRRVMHSVMHGAQSGTEVLGEQGRQALSEAMKGLDEALGAAAEATDLALREAAARGSEFSRQELRRSLDDLAGLEALFIETLMNAAKGATGLAATTLHDFAEHARSSGTYVGGKVEGSLAQLRHTLGDLARAQVEAGAHGLRSGSALFANIAAGFLAGIAQRLDPDRVSKTDSGRSAPRD
ncbi:MAG TPA: hypothetical protein PK725_05860 [Rhodocyclaceae bacterium]|nr:hypothetical protein [Rhodocyclaceae bacterium]HRQ46453.1 hypothetical protein [Rhodocyclaceae bacterium]